MSAPINPATFSTASDDQIIRQACAVLTRHPDKLTPALRRLTRSRKPDVLVAGKFLWAQLTGKGRA